MPKHISFQIGEPTFKLIETNLVEAEEPVEQIVNLIKELKSASNIIKSGLVFVQKNGVIVGIKMARNEPVWIQNMKRGIVQLFSVNFLGADKATVMFTKTEVRDVIVFSSKAKQDFE